MAFARNARSLATMLLLLLAGCGRNSTVVVAVVARGESASRHPIDLGSAAREDFLRQQIAIANPDSSSIDIVRFESSCQCASISPGELTVPAGGQETVELTVDLAQERSFTGQLGIEIDGYDAHEEVVFRLLALLDVRPPDTGAQHAAVP